MGKCLIELLNYPIKHFPITIETNSFISNYNAFVLFIVN